MSEPHTRFEPAPPDGPQYETKDAPVRPLVLAGLALFVALVLVGLAVHALQAWVWTAKAETQQPTAAPPVQVSPPPGAPRLQASPAADWAVHRAREQAVLDGWGWVDRPGGIARIPVQRAMELLAEQERPRP